MAARGFRLGLIGFCTFYGLAAMTPDGAFAGNVNPLIDFDASTWALEGNIATFQHAIVGAAAGTSSANMITPPASPGGPWTSSIIYSFNGQNGEGAYPQSGLIVRNGRVFGVTNGGGNQSCNNGCGTVLELHPPASLGAPWTETQMFKFSGDDNGAFPHGPPLVYQNMVFGTATSAANDTTRQSDPAPTGGVIFRLSPNQTTGWTYKLLYHFDAASLDGATPTGALANDSAGNLYGATFQGGKCGYGTVFELARPAQPGQPWTETRLHEFGATDLGCDYGDGRLPTGGVVLANGTLYGTTSAGTGTECGTIYSIALGATPTYQRLFTFGQVPGDACSPQAPVRVLSSGVILGTAVQGGMAPTSTECPNGCGALFTLTPASGSYTEAVAYSFTGATDGGEPRTNVLNFYGQLIGAANSGGNAGDLSMPDYTSFGALFRFKP